MGRSGVLRWENKEQWRADVNGKFLAPPHSVLWRRLVVSMKILTSGNALAFVPAMFRRLGALLMCLAMFSIAGGHWAVLQSVAWAGMLRDYSRGEGFGAAVEKTFSGKYPCPMCRKIAAAQKKQERSAPMLKVEKKAEVFLVARVVALTPPPPLWELVAHSLRTPPPVLFTPPRPVPRAA